MVVQELAGDNPDSDTSHECAGPASFGRLDRAQANPHDNHPRHDRRKNQFHDRLAKA